ncbi:hypothetical protein CALCODRAFT_555264 [Calocera cornea HHB12733]|uniref:Uncharacterized protein n=1 Tax=Calocera cornea HHB12733 TaxID=1353952 RepID=A0A165G4V1_9BASI|nr:hypothetical protein CALCODRAFT_555264 [Calocera cornea HHB12733]
MYTDKRSSLPGRLGELKREETLSVHRSASDRALRARPENRPSPAPVKRKAEHVDEKTDVKRIKVQEGEPSKRDTNKAKTVARHEKKAGFDDARKRWTWKHRALFAALLPDRSNFLENLRKDMSELHSQEWAIKEEEVVEQPMLVKGGVMKDYQLAGLSFLATMYQNGMNAILGDEMGLGKTLQTLSLFAYIKEQDPRSDPHLVVCPLSVITSWMNETARWVPSLRVLRFHGTQSERERLKDMISSGERFDILITTYESYKSEHRWIKSRPWNYCVLDEGHKIKNAESGLATALQNLGAAFRLILTGTPVHNNLGELWALLHWLYPTVFTLASESVFQDAFDLRQGKYDVKYLESAQKLLEVIMIRRTKNAVEFSVPPRDELTVFIPFTEAQRYWTYKLLTRMSAADLRGVFNTSFEDENETKQKGYGANTQYARLMNLLMQLRQTCDHPYMILGAEPDPYKLGNHVIKTSSKMIVIDKLLKDLIPKGERVLIFSQWTSMLDLLEDFMVLRKYRYARLDGSTPRPRRALDIRLFQQEKSPYDVYLISTKAGGLGINLTKATHVIMVDSDWNPQNDLQAIARAHRIGQTKTVKVYRLVCRGSVEDQMLDRIRRKLFLSLKIMNNPGSSSADDAAGMKMDELLSILRNGSSALDAESAGMEFDNFISAPIEEILRNSQRKQDVRDAKLKQEVDGSRMDERLQEDVAEEQQRLLSGVAKVTCRLFEGKVLTPEAIKSRHEEGPSSAKRARQNRLVKVNGIESLVVWEKPVQQVQPKFNRARKFEHEEWCLFCQDGGDLYMCSTCPRVFHAKCLGISDAVANRTPMLHCPQHNCMVCERSTSQAGGMLFRCATCANAFCEDCLPEGELDAVGDSIPQLTALGYGVTSLAFYIRCDECQTHPVIKYDEYDNKYWEENEVDIVDSDDDDMLQADPLPFPRPKTDMKMKKVVPGKKMKFEVVDVKPLVKQDSKGTTWLHRPSPSKRPQLPSPGDRPGKPVLIPRASSSSSMKARATHPTLAADDPDKKPSMFSWLAGKVVPSLPRTPVSEPGEPEVIDLTED